MSLDAHYTFRADMIDALVRDLIGPSSDDEIIDDPPIARYIAGVLYPRSSDNIVAEEDVDEPDDADETVSPDPPVALANVRYPSSMGVTFAVDSHATEEISVSVTAARYRPLADAANERTTIDQSAQPRRSVALVPWQRFPITVVPICIDVTIPKTTRVPLIDSKSKDSNLADGLVLFYRVRPADEQGIVPVTVVLLNANTTIIGSTDRDATSFFQSKIVVDAPGISKGAFVERIGASITTDDRDVRSYRLLYRNVREFAVGHGCAAMWTINPSPSDRAEQISTTFVPSYPVALAESNPDIQIPSLSMKRLVDGNRNLILTDLGALCDEYGCWIAERYSEASRLDILLQPIATDHLQDCDEALTRMRAGITLLASDDTAWQAFTLTNQVMLRQRARTVWLHDGKQTPEPIESEIHQWRPFQMAFILLCLRGIVDPASPDREIADLLWFPTGGGKTEAYLGLIAFTVFLRRLRNHDGGGVTALMRYTLRLLTIQQFERATLLICCCEDVRRSHTEFELGHEPITIGLWVGQGATPNTLDAARSALNKLRSGLTLDEGDPCQIRSCPWCGYDLDHRNYYIAADKSRLVISCRRPGCQFKDGLPVYVVDDDVYTYRPTLIIATVDKFASLPWRERTSELFNLQTGRQSEQLNPELIIQDELHLISGPLGTLVGLYETAVDALCTRNGIRPKVIASTATIRRASAQARALFNRPVRQFPPPGLDAKDSYFSVEAPSDRRGNRLYVGLMAPGFSHTTLLVRTYAALLQSAKDLPAADVIKDAYWTLVGYFNSLRVLGGARMQVQDDVGDRMELLARRAGTPKRAVEEDNRIELTSREPSSRIPEHLKRMAVGLDSGDDPLDVILATNMISVGVDIDRLGLMAMMGQPQSTSEYIQSTSRVGRKFPGLIVTLFNAARSRDRSHYESFITYHAALYRQVESTSVTPFSARARDRGLHAVIIALARLLVTEYRPNSAAPLITTRRAALDFIRRIILDRVQVVAPDEASATEAQIDDILDAWEQRVTQANNLVYSDPRNPTQTLLIDAAYEGPDRDDAFGTLWSLRDVDRESNLFLVQ